MFKVNLYRGNLMFLVSYINIRITVKRKFISFIFFFYIKRNIFSEIIFVFTNFVLRGFFPIFFF